MSGDEVAQLRHQVEGLDEENRELGRKVETLAAQGEAVAKEKDSLVKIKSDLEGVVQSLKEELEEHVAAAEVEAADRARMEAHITSLEATLGDSHGDMDNLMKDMTCWRKRRKRPRRGWRNWGLNTRSL